MYATLNVHGLERDYDCRPIITVMTIINMEGFTINVQRCY